MSIRSRPPEHGEEAGGCAVFGRPRHDSVRANLRASLVRRAASADTSKRAIVFAFPSKGAFALGDLTAAAATNSTTVSWWSSNWSQLNRLTSGSAPPAFLGFAGGFQPVPARTPPGGCTGTWATTGQTSTAPTTVPAYMGVLVTSRVTKSGGTIAGNTTTIVVIKVNGYSTGVKGQGTGTIVGTFCH